ncbi:hypothetical protein FHS85_001475 [Rhodoligotrophos appendicifer]|uniref:DUF2924 domain-containing protein n=1 Tax=Rhodoligotrophos appendicifer TaxID=987056 RepID=UPI0011860B41|nr:DUF2924 domain-containing protein [Rhodoligotrophos appendicifer]
MKGSKLQPLEERLARLETCPRGELTTQWQRIFDHPPPRGVKRQLLERAIAYELQAKVFGGLSRRSLSRLKAGEHPTIAVPSLKSGVRFVREWNGITHVVDRTSAGFIWKDQTFKSLSAVARAITGTRWSGPRFFGL